MTDVFSPPVGSAGDNPPAQSPLTRYLPWILGGSVVAIPLGLGAMGLWGLPLRLVVATFLILFGFAKLAVGLDQLLGRTRDGTGKLVHGSRFGTGTVFWIYVVRQALVWLVAWGAALYLIWHPAALMG